MVGKTTIQPSRGRSASKSGVPCGASSLGGKSTLMADAAGRKFFCLQPCPATSQETGPWHLLLLICFSRRKFWRERTFRVPACSRDSWRVLCPAYASMVGAVAAQSPLRRCHDPMLADLCCVVPGGVCWRPAAQRAVAVRSAGGGG